MGMISFKLIYKKNIAQFIKSYKLYDITEYTNSNYLVNSKDLKSVMNYCFFINKAIVI